MKWTRQSACISLHILTLYSFCSTNNIHTTHTTTHIPHIHTTPHALTPHTHTHTHTHTPHTLTPHTHTHTTHHTHTHRFEIEDVEESPATTDPQRSLTSNADVTFGYNTAEALPMTVYYRHATEDDGRPRPSLEYLREGRVELPIPGEGAEVSEGGGE